MSEINNEAGETTNILVGKKWYIAGPMSGMPRLNRPAFYEAATKLRKAGHKAVNPFELGVEDGKQIRDYMKVDIPAMLECDGVALLEGWEKSQGARLEALMALECGLDVRTIHCAFWHGFLDAYDGSIEPNAICHVTKDDVLKAFGMPDGLSQRDADASETVLRGLLGEVKGQPVSRPISREEFFAGCEKIRRPPEVDGAKGGETILEEAVRITSRDRQDDYGHPRHHFKRTIDAINAIFADRLKRPFEVSDWPLILILDKVSRQSNKSKRDNLVDIAGYARTAEMLEEVKKS